MSNPRWTSRPVSLPIGGRVVAVSELRVRDRDDLCAYLEGYFGAIADSLDPASPDYAAQLEWAYDHAHEWPPALGTPMADAAIYDEPLGLALFLALCIRGIDADDATALAATITDEELAAVEQIAWGSRSDPKAEVLRRIDELLGLPSFAPADDSGPTGEPITWEQAVGELVSGNGRVPGLGWASPEAVGELTLTQFRLARSGGEPEERGDALPADPELRERVEKARRAFFRIPDAVAEVVEASSSPTATETWQLSPEDGEAVRRVVMGLPDTPPEVDIPDDAGPWESAW